MTNFPLPFKSRMVKALQSWARALVNAFSDRTVAPSDERRAGEKRPLSDLEYVARLGPMF